MMTLLRRSTASCWSCLAGFLQLFCGVLSPLEASIISDDVSSSSATAVATPRWSDEADNKIATNRCSGVVIDGPGSCHCTALSEIHCQNLTAVPEFRRNGAHYSAAYFDEQEISSLPAAAFRHLRASRIVLNFNPIGAGLSGAALHGLGWV